MASINNVWVVSSTENVRVCNESCADAAMVEMTDDVFADAIRWSSAQGAHCSIISSTDAVPASRADALKGREASLFHPISDSRACDGISLVGVQPLLDGRATGTANEIIVRVARDGLGGFAETLISLIGSAPKLTVRHSDILLYDDEDFNRYEEQLSVVAEHLIGLNEDEWRTIDADHIFRSLLVGLPSCEAGVASVAVDGAGRLYLCPAAIYSGGGSFGDIRRGVTIPNQHLLERANGMPCRYCSSRICMWCPHLNRQATAEYCVVPGNACQLAIRNRRVQTWFTHQANELGRASADWGEPAGLDRRLPQKLGFMRR